MKDETTVSAHHFMLTVDIFARLIAFLLVYRLDVFRRSIDPVCLGFSSSSSSLCIQHRCSDLIQTVIAFSEEKYVREKEAAIPSVEQLIIRSKKTGARSSRLARTISIDGKTAPASK